MDNRLKRDLAKFFKKMNKNNLALFKEDKSKVKDLEKIEDEETLIKEGLKQCQFVLNHFSEKIDINLNKEKEEKERLEREKLEKERIERERKERERKEKERIERERKEKEKLIEKQKKEIEEKKLKELKEKELKKEKINQDEPKKESQKENKELIGIKAIQEKTKEKEKIESEIKKEAISTQPLEKKSSNKLPTLKRLPTLSQLTDEQFGSTEKAIYDLGDGIKIKVEWKYLRDKTYIPNEDEEDPEKKEKVDLIFTTNYIDPLILHWGVFRAFHESEWIHPEIQRNLIKKQYRLNLLKMNQKIGQV